MSDNIENSLHIRPNLNWNDICEFWISIMDSVEEQSEISPSDDVSENRRKRRHRSLATRMRINRYLSHFRCNLCSHYVRGGVITICGHLFCWTCLWPKLYDSPEPTCPRCNNCLVLHEDIVPVHGEGPNGLPDDVNVNAQPGNVPRPTGFYLQDHRYPHWFWIHPFRDNMQYYFIGERNLVTVAHQVKEQFDRSFPWIKLLEWLQTGCVSVLFFLSYYMSGL